MLMNRFFALLDNGVTETNFFLTHMAVEVFMNTIEVKGIDQTNTVPVSGLARCALINLCAESTVRQTLICCPLKIIMS